MQHRYNGGIDSEGRLGLLSGQSILCFAPDPWHDIWRNRHQIMSLLAEGNRVLYVEPRPYLRTVLGGGVPLSQWVAPRTEAIRPGLHVYRTPLYAPISGQQPLASLTRVLRHHSLRRAMRRLGMQAPILWLFRPDMDDAVGQCGESLVIYHIVDEYLGYPDLDPARREAVRTREQQLIRRADLVLVTSRALLESKGGLNPNTHWVPNAVDYDRFAEAHRAGIEPLELAGLPRPRIGYVGALNDKIDFALLTQVADAYAHVPMVLVGPVRVATEQAQRHVEDLRARPNVSFIGSVPVDRVPHFTAACDVGLLPYQLNAWTEHIHPLKLYEYLSCGMPVVSVDIPGVREEADLVHVAQDGRDFVEAVGWALADDSAEHRSRRQERASHNTWRHRVERISELISATYSRCTLYGTGNQ